MARAVTVEEITIVNVPAEVASNEVYSEEELKWFEETAKKYEDASTDLSPELEQAQLENSYKEWFQKETEAYFSPADYDSPEFQDYLKSFE